MVELTCFTANAMLMTQYISTVHPGYHYNQIRNESVQTTALGEYFAREDIPIAQTLADFQQNIVQKLSWRLALSTSFHQVRRVRDCLCCFQVKACLLQPVMFGIDGRQTGTSQI